MCHVNYTLHALYGMFPLRPHVFMFLYIHTAPINRNQVLEITTLILKSDIWLKYPKLTFFLPISVVILKCIHLREKYYPSLKVTELQYLMRCLTSKFWTEGTEKEIWSEKKLLWMMFLVSYIWSSSLWFSSNIKKRRYHRLKLCTKYYPLSNATCHTHSSLVVPVFENVSCYSNDFIYYLSCT